jgi:hypothetical protein
MKPTLPRPTVNFETAELRRSLKNAYATILPGTCKAVGSFTCGVYAFFDYDGEPIYVGQTFEGLSSRIGRHLTNQRTDAVAMSVLDPFEVRYIEMFPLCEFDGVKSKHSDFKRAKEELNRVELEVFTRCIAQSEFRNVLNEKDPALVPLTGQIPLSVRVEVVSEKVRKLRDHPDVRIARRAQTIARLAQVISERQVQVGLRQTLVVQAQRLEVLARRQFGSWGGELAVTRKTVEETGE